MASRRQSHYLDLLERVKKAASPIGMKIKLAKFLEVRPQRVAEWLSGKYEPGAEVALRMQEWVNSAEEKNKTDGSVTSTAAGKQTRKGRTRERKSKSGPP